MSGAVAIEQETLHEVRVTDNFRITPQGLVVSGQPTFDQCEALWETLRTFERTIQFAIGDAAKYIRQRFGEKADQIISAATGWTDETIRTYEWTAEKVPQAVRRMDVLSYSHHQAVGRLTPKEQEKWLNEAAKGDKDGKPWPVSQLKAAVKAGADEPVLDWVLVTFCDSERKRDALQAELEGRGLRCRPSDRRSKKEN